MRLLLHAAATLVALQSACALPTLLGGPWLHSAASCSNVDCNDGFEYQLIPGALSKCNDGYYCDCSGGRPSETWCWFSFFGRVMNPYIQDCELSSTHSEGFSCSSWVSSHPWPTTPAPTEPPPTTTAATPSITTAAPSTPTTPPPTERTTEDSTTPSTEPITTEEPTTPSTEPTAEDPTSPSTEAATTDGPTTPSTEPTTTDRTTTLLTEATPEEPTSPSTEPTTTEELTTPSMEPTMTEDPTAPPTEPTTTDDPTTPSTEATTEDPRTPSTEPTTTEDPTKPSTQTTTTEASTSSTTGGVWPPFPIPEKCTISMGDIMLPDPKDCNKYIRCYHGTTWVMPCAPGTAFSYGKQSCDFPWAVDCDNQKL